jgi:hypothetical protein
LCACHLAKNLAVPFAPSSDPSWLTITGVNNGVVGFSFPANSDASCTAHITLLGQQIPVTQSGVVLVTAMTIRGATLLADESFQFVFTNIRGASFTILSSTKIALSLSLWTQGGGPVESPPAQ